MSEEKIVSILKEVASTRTSDYSDEKNEAIVKASNSPNKELKSLCWQVVHESMKGYIDDFLRKFGVQKGSQDYGDYINELFIVIATNLERWDPSKGELTTYFKPHFLKACINYRSDQHSTFSSSHYELVNINIKRAKEALRQKGNTDPTLLEIRNYIASSKKAYSERTILNTLEQIKDISSIDANKELTDTTFTDPLTKILEDERKNDIISCIESLEPQHRILMQIIYSICQTGTNEKKARNKMIADEYRRRVGPASDEWIKSMRDAAERDFQHKYNSNRYKKSAQVNISSYTYEVAKQMEDDIKNAIAADIDSVFAEAQ